MCSEEVEDFGHFVLRYMYVTEERKRMKSLMDDREEEWQNMDDDEKLVVLMDRACWDDGVAKAVERLWWKRFTT